MTSKNFNFCPSPELHSTYDLQVTKWWGGSAWCYSDWTWTCLGFLNQSLNEQKLFKLFDDSLTNNKFNVEFLSWLKTWKLTGVVSTVTHLYISDDYGGVTVLQFFMRIWDSFFELFILTCKAVIFMKTSIISEHLLLTVFPPVKDFCLNVLIGAERTG